MADRTPRLPGLTPEGGPFNPVRDRFGRLRGPWKRPARFPCDFKRDNGCVCDLESVTTWCRDSGGETGAEGKWHRHPPGDFGACIGPFERHARCALHPILEGL